MTIPAETYWTLAQAIAWMCARDEAVVHGVSVDPSVEVLKSQLLKYRASFRCSSRERRLSTGVLFPAKFVAIAGTDGYGAADALECLCEAVLNGHIRAIACNTSTGSSGEIPGPERVGLEFRICPDDPIRPYGFFSKETGERCWIKPRVSALDVQRLAPAAHVPAVAAGRKRILARLRDITANQILTKEEAMSICERDEGFWRRGFIWAWAELPLDRKRRRGQHGPRIKAA